MRARPGQPGRATRAAAVAAALAVTASGAGGQLASPTPAALGLGGNFTALARGYAAPAWNPAGLGREGGPAFSVAALVPGGAFGIGPITLSDLARYEDRVVPTDVKRRWLESIRAEGAQAGAGGFEATWLALQMGPLAIQASTSAAALSDIAPGVAELLLFGNADEAGDPRDLDLGGSSMRASAYSSLGVSWGRAIPLSGPGRLAAGVTVTYTVGHFMAVGSGSRGMATSDPVTVRFDFPMVHTALERDRQDLATGGGFGLDLGAIWEGGPLVLGAALKNVVSGFSWDEDELHYRPLAFDISQDSAVARTDTVPLAQAPPGLRALARDQDFRPALALGAAYDVSETLTLAGDLRVRSDDGILAGETRHLGIGVEWRVLPVLPLRAGVAAISLGEDASGFLLSGGIGLVLGPARLGLSAARRDTALGTDTVLMASALAWGY